MLCWHWDWKIDPITRSIRISLETQLLVWAAFPLRWKTNTTFRPSLKRGQGNIDNDVNIAKLALALEIGAAVGYVTDTLKLKSPELIELEAGIACVEAIQMLAASELRSIPWGSRCPWCRTP